MQNRDEALKSYIAELNTVPTNRDLPVKEWVRRDAFDLLPTCFQELVSDLSNKKNRGSDVILFSIGCASQGQLSEPRQKLPDFIRAFPKENKIKVYLIDPNITALEAMSDIQDLYPSAKIIQGKSIIRIEPNIDVILSPCVLPQTEEKACKYIYEPMESTIRAIIEKNGKVFIANHTTGFGFQDVPRIADLYNRVKSSLTPEDRPNLQAYIQCGKTPTVKYFGDQLYDEKKMDAIKVKKEGISALGSLSEFAAPTIVSPSASRESEEIKKFSPGNG